MWTDPIVEEVRKNRDRIAKKKGYSLKRIFGNLKKKSPSGKRKTDRIKVPD